MIDSELAAARADSIARRWGTHAKPCNLCGHYVLYRHESGRRVALDNEGRDHGCDPAHIQESEMTKAKDKIKQLEEILDKDPLGVLGEPLKTYEQIQLELKKSVHPRHVSYKNKGGASIAFMPHGHIRNYLDMRAPGWSSTVEVYHAGHRLYVVLSLTIPTRDGNVTRTNVGGEAEDKSGYGDPSSNAHSTALRRAAMDHGFCRDWWTGNAPKGGR